METGLCEKFGKQGLTFDDVLLIPAESDVTPNMIDLRTRLAGNVYLNTPDHDGGNGHRDRGKNGDRHRP